MRKIIGIGFIVAFGIVVLWLLLPMPICAMTGNGTAGNPYVVHNVTDLQAVGNGTYPASAFYELGGDIDASATETWNWNAGRSVYEGFAPISGFTGHFNGNYSTISNLYMDWESSGSLCVGLFGSLGTGAHIGNVSIEAADVTAYVTEQDSQLGVGVLAGCIGSSGIEIENVLVHGVVIGKHYGNNIGTFAIGGAGGLVGYLYGGTGPIQECAAYVDVYGYSINGNKAAIAAGGFVGHYRSYAFVEILNCYARGDVLGNAPAPATHISIGGFVGERYYGGSNSLITNSYSTGLVQSNRGSIGGFIGENYEGSGGSCAGLTDNFWDKETSNYLTCDCDNDGQIMPRTTSEMKTESTYTSYGWDFGTIWDIGGAVNDGYPYFLWWYDPPDMIDDIYQVVWFQPNAMIEGTTLPNRTGEVDGIITWGANPAGIDISYGSLIPEEEYTFEPIAPGSEDIIKPRPPSPTTDVDTTGLMSNPLYPLVSILASVSGWNERLVWLLFAWLIVIVAMLGVHLGFDTKKDTEKPHHFVLTSITGLGLSIVFYTMGIFPLWVIILMAFGLVGAIVWERQPVM